MRSFVSISADMIPVYHVPAVALSRIRPIDTSCFPFFSCRRGRRPLSSPFFACCHPRFRGLSVCAVYSPESPVLCAGVERRAHISGKPCGCFLPPCRDRSVHTAFAGAPWVRSVWFRVSPSTGSWLGSSELSVFIIAGLMLSILWLAPLQHSTHHRHRQLSPVAVSGLGVGTGICLCWQVGGGRHGTRCGCREAHQALQCVCPSLLWLYTSRSSSLAFCLAGQSSHSSNSARLRLLVGTLWKGSDAYWLIVRFPVVRRPLMLLSSLLLLLVSWRLILRPVSGFGVG